MPKHKAKLKTAIGAVVDESGSMYSRAEETRRAFNTYFDDIQKEDPTAVVTAANFSARNSREDNVRFLSRSQKVTDIPYLDEENYSPNGNTPLFDAVAHVINELSNTKADRYLVVILTDGFENASREYSRQMIQSLIASKEATDQWTFVYLGAGSDSWGGFSQLGISTPDTKLFYSGAPGTTASSVTRTNVSTKQYLRSSKTSDPNFFEKEKS